MNLSIRVVPGIKIKNLFPGLAEITAEKQVVILAGTNR